MKRKNQILFLLAGISVILISLTGCENKKRQGTVIAKFRWHWYGAQQYITNEEMEQKISKLPEYRQQNLEKKERRIEYFNENIVDERLKFLAAKDAGLHKKSETEEKLREYLNQLMVEKLAKQEVDDKVSVTEDDMKDYYEKNKNKYIEPEKVRLTCIILEDKEKAEKVFRRIKRGEDIVELEKEVSDMELNLWPRGSDFIDVNNYRVPEFVKAVSEVKVGQMTPEIVVQKVRDVPSYYIMFRKEEVKAPIQKTLEEVKEDVQGAVESANRRARMNEWVEELYTESNLKIFKDKIPPPTTETKESEAEAEKEETTESTEESKKKKHL